MSDKLSPTMLEDLLKTDPKPKNEVIHFEELWEKAEQASVLEFKEIQEIVARMASNVSEIKDIYRVAVNSSDAALIKGVKSKAIGRLLFALTALSAKEGIDVYSALKDQWDISEFKNSIAKSD